MKKLIIVLGLLAVLLSGCTEKAPTKSLNETQIKDILMTSTENLSSYSFSLENSQMMSFINDTSSNNTTELAPAKVTTSTKSDGAIDLKARSLHMVTVSTAVPEGKEANKTTSKMEMYFINDTVYMKIDDENWTKMKINNPTTLWSTSNMAKNEAALLNVSNLTSSGMETIDGIECYKIAVKPDIRVYSLLLSQQIGSAVPVFFLNLTKLYNETDLKWDAWITADTNQFKKNSISMKMKLNPEIMNIKEMGNFSMDIETGYFVVFKDYDKELKIEPPAEAMTAELLPEVPIQ
jgi:hypothetical protein